MTNEMQKSEGYSTREIIIAVIVTLVIVAICVASAVVGYGMVERYLGAVEPTPSGAEALGTQPPGSQEEGDASITAEALLLPGEGTGGTGRGTTTTGLVLDAAGLALCGGVLVIVVGGIFLLDRYYRNRNIKI